MEEKIQSVQYRDSEPSEFAHKPPKQEMDLSCFPGRLSPIERSHRFDSVLLQRHPSLGCLGGNMEIHRESADVLGTGELDSVELLAHRTLDLLRWSALCGRTDGGVSGVRPLIC